MRGLVEHSLRAGDLSLETFRSTSSLDGIRGHQKVQGSRPGGYHKEVPVSRTFEKDDFLLEVGGRIDGVWERPSGDLVEEIKTTRGDAAALAERDSPIHWGQLKVYAFLYAEEKGLPAVDTRLVYYQLDTGALVEVERRFTLDELRLFSENLVARYLSWMSRIAAWIDSRNASLAPLGFPFPSYRPGQRRMAVAVYRSVRQGGALLAQAPTGIGKTAAALFPAAKALGEGKTDRVFYLTARTTGRALAEKSLAELRSRGAKLRAVTLTAKEKICFNPEKACNGEECSFARGFYDRIEPAHEEALHLEALTRSGVESLARKHHLCPFELSLELASRAELVIGDYNYAFDPRTYLRRFFDDGSADSTLLVDEAHNLVDRARDMYSAGVSRQAFLSLSRALDRERDRNFLRAVRRVNGRLRDAVARCRARGGAFSESTLPQALVEAVLGFVRAAETFLAPGNGRGGETRSRVLERFFEAAWFSRVAERFDQRYVTCYRISGNDLEVKLFCSDPARELQDSFSRVKASVLFSGTLTPTAYFRRTLGLSEETSVLVLPSPFPRDNLRVLMAPGVATTFRKRAASEAALTALLSSFARQRRGNYLFYFPSYTYLNAILRRFGTECPELDVLVQSPAMSEPERDEFLGRFESGRGTLVGFAVMGGFFGEGIDLPGDRLQGAAIVGVGLPGLSPERDRIRERFERDEGAGFDFAYVFPGMNRVLQAAGRVIRSEDDRGVVLLVDERFAERRYRTLLPPEWDPRVVRSPPELRHELEQFWGA